MKYLIDEVIDMGREQEIFDYVKKIYNYSPKELAEEIVRISKEEYDRNYSDYIYEQWMIELPKNPQFELLCSAISDKFYMFVEDEDEIQYIKDILAKINN